jgi:hypothetical protein
LGILHPELGALSSGLVVRRRPPRNVHHLPSVHSLYRPSFSASTIRSRYPNPGPQCWNCFKQIANAGIVRICFGEFYRDSRIFDIAQQIGIELVHIALPGVSLPPLTAPSPPTASGGE